MNMQTINLGLALLALNVIWTLIVCLVAKVSKHPKIMEKADSLINQSYASDLFNISLEANLEFLLCGYIQFADDRDQFAYKIGLGISGGANLVLLVGFVRILFASPDQLMNPDFIKRWGVFFFDIRTRLKMHVAFHLFQTMRRVAFISILLFIKSTGVQLIAIFLLSELMMMYQGHFRPLASKMMNRVQTFNEYMVTIFVIFSILFTDYV